MPDNIDLPVFLAFIDGQKLEIGQLLSPFTSSLSSSSLLKRCEFLGHNDKKKLSTIVYKGTYSTSTEDGKISLVIDIILAP